MTAIDPPLIAQRAADVRTRIERAGGDPAAVLLLAVTKGFPAEIAAAARDAGLVDLGENYPQELAAKAQAVDRVRWHAIGRLQRNKVRLIAPVVSLWHSVDRIDLGIEIAARAPGAAVLVQVNVTDESQKGGCEPADTPALVRDLRQEGLDVRGLMTVGRTGPPAEARAGFAVLRHLADDLGLVERSMGMSGDLDQAIAEGATIVRVGSALFGARPARPQTDPA